MPSSLAVKFLPMDDLSVYVITTKKNWLRRIAISLTWGHRLNPTFYSDHSSRNVIKVSNSNEYSSGVEKQMNILRLLNSSHRVNSPGVGESWFLFIDDDTFLNWREVKSVLGNLNPNSIYSELHDYEIQEKNGNNRILSTRKNYPKLNHGMHGGAGIFISKRALDVLSFIEINLEGVENGDVAFSILAHENNISLCGLEGLNWNNPKFYGHTINQMKEQISYHYVMPAMMVSIFLRLHKVGHQAASMLSRFSCFVRNRLHKWKSFGRIKGKYM